MSTRQAGKGQARAKDARTGQACAGQARTGRTGAGPASTGQTAGGRAGPRSKAGGGGARGALGRYGEELAARYLTGAGMTILERNWRCGRTGEIDIVARDGDAVVVCEVKTRSAGAAFEHPMAAVTPAKAARLRSLAECWLQQSPPGRCGGADGVPPGGVRIDLVGVLLPERGAPVVEHARGVA